MNRRYLAFAALLAIPACGGGEEPVEPPLRIDCGVTDIIISNEQANALLAGSGESAMDVGDAICAAFADVDSSQYTEPTEVMVLTENGARVTAQVQASQQ